MKGGPFMKIAVTGKGGVGKTFIAGTLATLYARGGRPVIAIDADPSPNLAMSLGLSDEEATHILPIAENEELIRLKTTTDHPGVFRLTFTVDDIIKRYAVPTPSGAYLMVMGTVRALGSGCTCPANTVVKALLRHLLVERDDVVILDMEAGIEHLGRGTAEHVDVMLVITDANKKSLETARAICRMAAGSPIRQVGLVANKITSPAQREIVSEFARRHTLPVLGVIPFDQQVFIAGVTGEQVDERTSLALAAVSQLAQRLTDTPVKSM
jgi:CO dehydrogenase maturation factor